MKNLIFCTAVLYTLPCISVARRAPGDSYMPMALAQAHKIARKKIYEKFLTDVGTYAQKNKLNNQRFAHIYGCLRGATKITDINTLNDELREFATVVARMNNHSEKAYTDSLIATITQRMQQLQKKIDQQMPSIEFAINEAVEEALATMNITRNPGIKLQVGDGAGNQVFTVEDTGASTLTGTGANFTINNGSTNTFAITANTGVTTIAHDSATLTVQNAAGTTSAAITNAGNITVTNSGTKFQVLGASGNTTVGGTLGVTGISTFAQGTYTAPGITYSGSSTTGNYYYNSITRIDAAAFSPAVKSGTFKTSYGPAVTFCTNNTFAIAYNDNGTAGTVEIQPYTASYAKGTAITDIASGHAPQAASGIALTYDATDNYLIAAWIENTTQDVYIRRYNMTTQAAVEAAIKVSGTNTAPADTGYRPAVVVSGDGTIAVFWTYQNGANYEIYTNTVTATGTVDDTPTRVSDATYLTAANLSPSATYAGGSTAIVCWNCQDLGSEYLWGCLSGIMPSSGGTRPTGTITQLSTSKLNATCQPATAAINHGNAIFTYKDVTNGYLYYEVYNNALTSVITAETSVSGTSVVGDQSAAGANGTSFIVCWEQDTNKLFVRNYTRTGTAVDAAYPAIDADNIINSNALPAIALCGGNSVVAWFAYNAGDSDTVNGQAFSLKGLGTSTIGTRNIRTTDLGTDVYGTLNVAGGDVYSTGSIYINGTLGVGSIDISGDITVRDGAGNVVFSVDSASGNVCSKGSGSWSQSSCAASDQRLKTKVSMLDEQNCLKAINQLRPISYNWTAEYIKAVRAQDTKQIGLIAQEVEKLIPEVVLPLPNKIGEYNDLRGISYERLVPYLIASIQALNKKIEVLEARNKSFLSKLFNRFSMHRIKMKL